MSSTIGSVVERLIDAPAAHRVPDLAVVLALEQPGAAARGIVDLDLGRMRWSLLEMLRSRSIEPRVLGREEDGDAERLANPAQRGFVGRGNELRRFSLTSQPARRCEAFHIRPPNGEQEHRGADDVPREAAGGREARRPRRRIRRARAAGRRRTCSGEAVPARRRAARRSGCRRRAAASEAAAAGGDEVERPGADREAESRDGGAGRAVGDRGRRHRDAAGEERAEQMPEQQVRTVSGAYSDAAVRLPEREREQAGEPGQRPAGEQRQRPSRASIVPSPAGDLRHQLPGAAVRSAAISRIATNGNSRVTAMS